MVIQCQWEMCKFTREIPETTTDIAYRKAVLEAGWVLRMDMQGLSRAISGTSDWALGHASDLNFPPENDLVYCSDECSNAHYRWEDANPGKANELTWLAGTLEEE